MCGGSPSVDNSIQREMLADSRAARRKEEEREARIREGTAAIDQQFQRFDDTFFDTYQNQFMDYYQPQLDDKFSDASDDLTYALARAGTLNSSMAADGRADLNTAYDDARAGVLSEAVGARSDMQNRINNERSSLVSVLNATGNSERAANQALSRSRNLFEAQPEYSPLGDVFAGATRGYGAAAYGQQQQDTIDYYNRNRNGGTGRTSSSSSRVVN